MKRNQLKNSNCELEPKVMLAAASTEPATLQLQPNVAEGAQAGSDLSAELGVEIGGNFDAEGTFIEGEFVAGGEASLPALPPPPEGGGRFHTHPSENLSQGAEAVFLDSNGQPAGEALPASDVVVDAPPSPTDNLLANAQDQPVSVVPAGDSIFAFVPSDEGVRRGEGLVDPARADAEIEQTNAIFLQNIETGTKRAQAEADREGGGIGSDQAQDIFDNAGAKTAEFNQGTLFRGDNDGSGTLTEVVPDPSIS